MIDSFKAGSIDHMELVVPDQSKAAEWYSDVPGLEILREYDYGADLT